MTLRLHSENPFQAYARNAILSHTLVHFSGVTPNKRDAEAARQIAHKQWKDEADGKPPRRGPSDLLRQLMKFTVDLTTYTLSVGPILFKKQPKLVGVLNVPELLEFGGKEQVKKELVQYQPRPFVAPALEKAQQRMAQLIESEQLRP